jgi:hypothetical protein
MQCGEQELKPAEELPIREPAPAKPHRNLLQRVIDYFI